MTELLRKERKIRNTKTHREEGPVNMEAEIGVTLPQAKELCSSQKLEEVNMADTLISDLSLQL